MNKNNKRMSSDGNDDGNGMNKNCKLQIERSLIFRCIHYTVYQQLIKHNEFSFQSILAFKFGILVLKNLDEWINKS